MSQKAENTIRQSHEKQAFQKKGKPLKHQEADTEKIRVKRGKKKTQEDTR